MAKVLIGNFKGPQGEQGVKGDPGTAASIQVGTTQTVQPEANAEVANTGTANAAVLNFKIPRGEDGMTDLTAEYKDASEYTCHPTVNAPVVLKEILGKTEQGADPSPDNPQVIKGVGGMGYFDGTLKKVWYDDSGNPISNVNYYSSDKMKCNAGDTIKVKYEQNIDSLILNYWNSSGEHISYDVAKNANVIQKNTPANSKYFAFSLNASNITNYPAKYVSVTINGEYQTGVETQGRNLFDASKLPTKTQGGATVTNNGDGIFTISGSGNASENVNIKTENLADYFKSALKPGKLKINTSITNPVFYVNIHYQENGESVFKQLKPNGILEIDLTDENISAITTVNIGFTCAIDASINPGTIRPMLYQSGDGTWQPYHHATLTIPLTSPLYEGDKICYVKPGDKYVNADGETVTADRVLYGCYRENVAAILDGSSDESLGKNSGGGNLFSCTITNKAGSSVGGEQNLKCNKLTTAITNSNVSDMPDNSIKESGTIGSNIVFLNISEAGTTVESLRAWLSTNQLTVVYKLAQPYFEPFPDQSIFYTLRTDDTLSYVYSNDPIEPVLTVEVAKNSTGGYLLESYATAQKNALSEADNASRLAAVEQQLLTLNTTVSAMGGAVSDLQTNTYALKGGIEIPENADLNDYKTPGNYYCPRYSAVQTLDNCPFTSAFTLKVSYGTGNGYPMQTFTEYNTDNIAIRFYNQELPTKTWSEYKFLTPTTQS